MRQKKFRFYNIDRITKQNYNAVVEEAKLAIRLGIKPKLSQKGYSGTYFLKDRFGKNIAVYKPIGQGPYEEENPKWINYFRKRIPFVFEQYGFNPKETHLSEVGASLVDEVLHLNIIPKTKIVSLTSSVFQGKNKEGSLQLFVRNGKDAKALKEQEDLSLEISNFEKLAFLDLLIFNIDRNFDNWFIIETPYGKKKVVAIDNSASFPYKHSKRGPGLKDKIHTYFNIRHQYEWESLRAANKPFSQTLLDNFDEDELIDQLREAMMDEKQKTIDRKIDLFRLRLRVLKVLMTQNKTIREIAA